LLAVDNYGSLGDDNTSDEDDDNDDSNNDNDYYESGAPLVTFPDSDSYYTEFGVPNTGSPFEMLSQTYRKI